MNWLNGLQILFRHLAEDGPRHRWAEFGCACDHDPLFFGGVLHVKPKITDIGRAPGDSPAGPIPGQPVFLRYLARRIRIARRVAIIAACNCHEIAPAVATALH